MVRSNFIKENINQTLLFSLSLSLSFLGQYFASIMIIVGMSVIATVIVLQYHHHDPNGGNMPKWVNLSHLSPTWRSDLFSYHIDHCQ